MLPKDKSPVSVVRFEPGSELDLDVSEFLEEVSVEPFPCILNSFFQEKASRDDTTYTVFASRLKKLGTVAAACTLKIDSSYAVLTYFSVADSSASNTRALLKEVIDWLFATHPQTLLVVEESCSNGERTATKKDGQFYITLGFLSIASSDSFLFFPPSHISKIRQLTVWGMQNDDPSSQAIVNKLGKIETLEYVPLVALQYLLDSKKLGQSIVDNFVHLALQLQRVQEYGLETLSEEECVKVIREESLLLKYAWERLNTGHFSEVDLCWRKLYAIVSLTKAVRLAAAVMLLLDSMFEWDNCSKKPVFVLRRDHAIAAVDLGLLMGDGVPEQLLQRYAQFCDRHLPVPPDVHENEVTIAVRTLPNSVPIPVLDELSKWDFFDQYFPRQEPVIVKGLNRHWPAVKNWSFNHLHKILCHRVLPVEQGSKYTDSNWAQMLMTGSQFFTTCTLPVDEKGPLYLAQHRLFHQVPVFREDISLPLYCDHCEFDEVDKNCWIGPGGTISPLHTDPRENVFSQIVGRKFFRLVSPAESDKVYAFKDGLLTNTSQVDVLNPDLDKYPEFAKAKCWDGVVEGGDVLYIPKGWWHLVASLTNSIAFAFWFDK